MLQVVNLSKTYGDQILFEDVSFSMVRGERLGLVGRNGSGKSTLFKIILGEEQPDQGSVVFPRGYVCGHLAQHLDFKQPTVLTEACLGLPEAERDQEYRAEIILGGLGFSEDDMHLPPANFSGGFQIRINLAKVLLSEPNLLLLDEPTNYLDIVSARWLSRFLRSWQNEIVIITHDKDFMDSVCTHTMLIHRQKVKKISGGTKKLYDQVMQDEEIYEKTRVNEDKKRREMELFINRFRAQAAKATLVQSKVKALERMGKKEELQDEKTLDFDFRAAPFQGKIMLEAKELSFAYDSNSSELPLINNFSISIKPNDRIGVIGKNGKGKSTLLKLLARELKAQRGEITISPNAKIGYFGQTNISRLNPKLTVEEEVYQSNPTLSRTGVRNICGTMMFEGDKALKKVSVLSGGEKSRVLLGKLIAEPSNLLLLDEPTNHLDLDSIEALAESVKEYPGALVLVTHSELLLRELVTKLIVIQDDGPEIFDGDYDYFLSKVGWNDEADLKPTKREKSPKNDEAKKSNQPSNKDIEAIEKKLKTLEKEIDQLNKELIDASDKANTSRITILGQSIAEKQESINEQYEKLENLLNKN